VERGEGRLPVVAAPRRKTGVQPKNPAVTAISRLERVRGFQTLVRGAIPTAALKRLLKDAMPARSAREMPPEVWSAIAAGIAAENPIFGVILGRELDDRLRWDKEPEDLDRWWQMVRERPLEALWMAASSETPAVRKEFTHLAEHCLENFRLSPEATPPSWEFLEGVLDVHAQLASNLRDQEKAVADAERRLAAEAQRFDELRTELKRLRRENADLRAARATAERTIETLNVARARTGPMDASRVEELERRALRAEQEREHLLRELERRSTDQAGLEGEPPAPAPKEVLRPEPPTPDPGPRARVLRHIVRRLFTKGKIGSSHTHEDNVLRGLPDHEKGIAKEAMSLLYREGLLVPKPTVADPHLSLSPDRTAEILEIINGESRNPRILRFVQG
jgi:hypothetical protein